MAEKSYGFAIGNLRARENALLKTADLQQLCGIKSVDTLAVTLRDKGFGDRTAQADVPELLAKNSESLWAYLREIAPNMGVFEPFLLEHDFHNCKAILKSLIRNIDPTEYLLTPSVYDPALIQKAFAEKRFDLLSDEMRPAVIRAYEIMTTDSDPALCDAVLDAACMTAQLHRVNAKGFGCPLAKRLIEQSVFLSTVKAALRCAATEKSAAFLDAALPDTPFVSAASLKAAALGGVEKVLTLLRSRGKIGIAAADAFGQSPADFERFCDDTLTETARAAKRITLGVEPIIGYYMARRAEEKNIRIIYSAVKTGQPEEQTLGRLRLLYG